MTSLDTASSVVLQRQDRSTEGVLAWISKMLPVGRRDVGAAEIAMLLTPLGWETSFPDPARARGVTTAVVEGRVVVMEYEGGPYAMQFRREGVPVPSGVDISIDGSTVSVKGPKGALSHTVAEPITVARDDDGAIVVTRPNDERESRSLHGLTRTLVNNMMLGVTEGYEKKLEIVGVGYRVISKGPKQLEFALGFSHPVLVKAPQGVTITVDGPTKLTVSGIDKQQVGEVAANIRKLSKPEPYKGKGVRYLGEHVARKAGKTAK